MIDSRHAQGLLRAITLTAAWLIGSSSAHAATLLGDTIFGGVGTIDTQAIPGPGLFASNTAVVGPGIEFEGDNTKLWWKADFSGTESSLLTISIENINFRVLAQNNWVWVFYNLDWGPVPQNIIGVTQLNSTFSHHATVAIDYDTLSDGHNWIKISQTITNPSVMQPGTIYEASFAITIAPVPDTYSPSIRIGPDENPGMLSVDFKGIFQYPIDLETFIDFAPQPLSPYIFPMTTTPRFFRAR